MQHALRTGLLKIRRGKDNSLSKKVVCILTGKVFHSIQEASKFKGIDKTVLSRKLRGIYRNNTGLRLLNEAD